MADILHDLQIYLDHAAGLSVTPKPWCGARGLPPFLEDRYDFYEVQLRDMPCLLMVHRQGRDEPPAAVRKHVDQVHQRWDGPVVYVRREVTAYNRKRLIEQRVPFIVPGNQMYLPPAGIDLREHFRKLRIERPHLRPSSQAALIHMLLHAAVDFALSELASTLLYSAMTVSRALDELETAELVETYPQGRERLVRLPDAKHEVWQRAQPFLRNPVQRRRWAQVVGPRGWSGPRAGLTALAQYSNLAEPQHVVFALGSEEWRPNQQRHALREVEAAESGAIQLEIWSYSPTPFAANGLVDRLSLYLSLRETPDERVQAAINQMMGEMPW